jgi:hypothetical protein
MPPANLAHAPNYWTAYQGKVGTPQSAHVLCHRIQYRPISGRDPQPGGDRGTGRPGHLLHPAPLTQPHRRHPASPARSRNLYERVTAASAPALGVG